MRTLSTTATGGAVKIDGRKLAKRRRRISATHRAMLAYQLAHGEVVLSRLTNAQACAIAGANREYVATIAAASDLDRGRVRQGFLPLADLHKRRKQTRSDTAIDRLVERIGPARVMQALDRLTAPRAA